MFQYISEHPTPAAQTLPITDWLAQALNSKGRMGPPTPFCREKGKKKR